MTDDTSSLTRLDAIAVALVERALPATIRLAADTEDLHIAQRLRGRAMIEAGWVGPGELDDGRDEDVHDEGALHLLAFLDGSPVGTCRLILPEKRRLLPVEQVPGASRVPKVAVEVGRVVVIRSTARHERSVMAGLIARAWLEVRARGHRRICGIVAAPMLRLFRRMGFVVGVFGPQVRTFGEDRFPILFEPGAAAATLIERYGDRFDDQDLSAAAGRPTPVGP